MARKETDLKKEFSKGVLKENPVLRLMLGMCPALAVTTTARNGLGMGLATLFVLMGSNIAVSVLRKLIPEKVRIPSFILIIAGFVTIVHMLIQAYLPALNDELGIFIPLIVVNCVILARAEVFASKNPVLPSIVDALGMGSGFTAALFLIGGIREIFGFGTIFDISIPLIREGGFVEPMLVFILPPGGFFVFGLLIAISQKLSRKFDLMAEKKEMQLNCQGCDLCCSSGENKCLSGVGDKKEGGDK